MVLKRLFVTALGALGLGALATGPASAQQVPPPDFFGDQIACSSSNAMATVPDPLAGTGANMMGPSLLEQALRGATGMGDPQMIDTTGDAGMSLGFVIDATVANCGQGAGTTAFVDGDANLDLATGYTQVLTQFNAVVREENAVRMAQRALTQAIEAGTTGTPLDNLREALTEAQEDLATETAKLNSLGAGPIYQAGIREWRAMNAVNAAVTKWDEGVASVTTTLTDGTDGLRAAQYGDYVVLPGQSLLDALTNADGELQRAAVAAYIGEANNGVTTGFDEDGNLILTDADDDDVPDVTATGVGAIMDNSAKADAVVAALQEAIGDTSDEVQARRLREALRRAQIEKSHLNEYLRRALNDNTELDASAYPTADDYELDSIRTRNAAYQKALSDRTSAEAELRSAVAARHAATQAVQMAFQGPGSYYDQYVARHTYHVSNAQKAVDTAVANGVTPSKTLTDAVTNTQKALDTATMARDRFQAMVADSDNPAVNLIHDLLAPDGQKADDDGQAVVDAVSDTYGVAKDARDTANRVADEVAGLTGDEGQVSQNTSDIEDLDGRVTTNEETLADHGMKLMAKKEYIENLAEEIGVDPVTGMGTGENGMSRIDMNAMGIMGNAENIATNAGNIMANTDHIMTNRGMIEMNSGSIAMNSAGISANSDAVSSNADAIAANMNSIGQNSSAISDNRNMIGELSEDLDVVRAGVAASMALAGMPAINGRGISIGVGSFDGESAFAVGFQIQGEMASFKVGVTSASGATGASAGVGFQF